jgi:hypothetical protein
MSFDPKVICNNTICSKKDSCWHYTKESVIPKIYRVYSNRESLNDSGFCLEYKHVIFHDINLS